MGLARFLIAAPRSGSGKTTVALGLMAAFRQQGLNVRPFKCGPDYIDGQFHTLATGKPSINLDPFMMSETHIQGLFEKHTSEADVAVVEGVMGLFDGSKKDEGSSAAIAALLQIPVLLVVDASAVAYSVAPLIHGFNSFKEGVRISGVIFNRVNSASHFQFLQEACEDAGVDAIGHLPSEEEVGFGSRHLGLSTQAIKNGQESVERTAQLLKEHIAIDRLLETTRGRVEKPSQNTFPQELPSEEKLRVAVARDDAFSFIYHENLEALKRIGEVESFSPVEGETVPENADLLYISGGYPEDHLEALSKHEGMLRSLRDLSENGGRIIAECGGMMLLGRAIIDEEGRAYPMAGIFPFRTSMEPMKRTLGYRKVELGGREFRGHEFHYSVCSEEGDCPSVGKVSSARGQAIDTKLYLQKRTFASYIHFYWGEGDTLTELLRAIEGAPERTSL